MSDIRASKDPSVSYIQFRRNSTKIPAGSSPRNNHSRMANTCVSLVQFKENRYRSGDGSSTSKVSSIRPVFGRSHLQKTSNRRFIFVLSRRLIHDGLYMEIDHLTLNDAGRYTCVAENQAGRAETHVDIDVAGLCSRPPSSSTAHSDTFSSTGLQRFSITNEVVSAPQYHYHSGLFSLWLSETIDSLVSQPELIPDTSRKDRRVDHRSCSSDKHQISQINHRISFFVQIADAGIYECIATNKAGEARRQFHVEPYGRSRLLLFCLTVHLVISAPPSIGLSNETRRLIVPRHQRLTVTCPATGHPSPATRWSVR